MSFTHLHLHTEFSMLDGLNKIENLAKRIKELGMDSVAMTDHGNMFGALEFYVTMKQYGINPIIGIETYLHNSDELSDKSTRQRFHLCLFAKNKIGYQNLMYLSSQAFINGFYSNARINKKLLRERSEGLVCSSACLQGEVNWHLNVANPRNKQYGAKGYEMAKEVAMEYKEIFGDDFYLEIMRHGIGDQHFIDEQILRIAKELNIKVIATNDTHYTMPNDADTQNIAFQINMGRDKAMKHVVKEFYVKSPQEMKKLFLDIPEAIENTQEIAQKCRLELDLKNIEIKNKQTGELILKSSPATPPSFKLTKQYAQNENLAELLNIPLDSINDSVYFVYKCKKGLENRLKSIESSRHEEYWQRLEREIEIINKMKFPGYMLIVWDFINFAKKNDIPVGPGRGSAAGSLVAYALNITNIDPLKYNLLFERFLNPERISMPDIDTDFHQKRRGEVIDYMINTYGKYNVAQVITFNSLKAKGVIRDVARVLDMPLNEADAFAKLIPNELNITLQKHIGKDGKEKEGAWEKEPKIRALVDSNPLAKKVWENALSLEHIKRNAGLHAAAIVVDSNEELWNKVPLFTSSKMDGIVATQYEMGWLEPVDLIKFDFLGLKTLDVIDDALKLIKKRYDITINFDTMEPNDQKVFENIQTGNTLGLFQIEGAGFQNLASRLKPSNFEDIIAMIALYRPGPMDFLPDFIAQKHGQKEIKYIFPQLKPILESTYGIIVYQEQVMQIVQTIGGFSLGGADLVRRAMGKKKLDEMLRLKEEFSLGAQKQGLDKNKAQELWDMIVKFAGYGFNKSHAAAYGMLTYQTAYLKTYYQHEFMAAMLTSEVNKIETMAKYIDEVRKMNIQVLPPHVNLSLSDFSVIEKEAQKCVIFGLSAIKGVSSMAIENIILERESNGEFKDLADFISRIDFSAMTKRSLEPLIKAGALDNLGYSRRCMLSHIDEICNEGRRKDKELEQFSGSLFGEQASDSISVRLNLQDMSEFDNRELIEYEYECIGTYINGHPLDDFKDSLDSIKNLASIAEIKNLELDSYCILAGKVFNLTKKLSKKSNKFFGTMELLDYSGKIEIMIFEKQLEQLESMDWQNVPLALKCKIEEREGNISLKIIEMTSITEGKNLKASKKYKPDEIAENEPSKPSVLEKPDVLDSCISLCTPLCVLLESRQVQEGVLEKLKAQAQRIKGNRELRIQIKDMQGYTFISNLQVDSSIKTEFAELQWQEQ